MAGWHHQCNGHELGQTTGDGEGQRDLACCSPWGYKELDMTERQVYVSIYLYIDIHIYYHNGRKLEINYKKNTVKFTNIWKSNNMPLINPETNENAATTFQNLYYAAQVVLRGKFLVIQSYLRNRKNLK